MILFIDTSTSYPIVSIIENNNIKAMFNYKTMLARNKTMF